MNFNFLNLDKDKSRDNSHSNFINSFLKELQDYIKNPKNNMFLKDDLYQIDRFEGDKEIFAVCQNLKTKEMFNIPKSEIPKEATDAYVLKVKNGSYIIDYETTKQYVSGKL